MTATSCGRRPTSRRRWAQRGPSSMRSRATQREQHGQLRVVPAGAELPDLRADAVDPADALLELGGVPKQIVCGPQEDLEATRLMEARKALRRAEQERDEATEARFTAGTPSAALHPAAQGSPALARVNPPKASGAGAVPRRPPDARPPRHRPSRRSEPRSCACRTRWATRTERASDRRARPAARSPRHQPGLRSEP